MQFLKILFWCLLAFIAALFTYGNWNTVPVHLWSGLVADVNLPLLLLVTFLVGLVPTQLYNLAVRWRLRQRLSTAERQLADTRAVLMTPSPPVQPAQPLTEAPAGEPQADAAPSAAPGQLL